MDPNSKEKDLVEEEIRASSEIDSLFEAELESDDLGLPGNDIWLNQLEDKSPKDSVSKEELNFFYSSSKRGNKKKKHSFFNKYLLYILTISVILIIFVLGILLITSIKKVKTPSSHSSMKDQDQILSQEASIQIETLEKQVANLTKKLEQQQQENTELKKQIEELQDSISEESQTPPVSTSNNSGSSTSNQEPPPTNTAEQARAYIVKKGDTLWKISKEMYGDGGYINKIITANQLKGENPVIHQGMTLTIPPR